MARQAKNLTPAAIEKATKGNTEKLIAVGHGIPGLCLRITARRSTFQFRYRSPLDGKWRMMTLGTYPSMSLDKAIEKGRDLRRVVEAGGDPRAEAEAAKGRTFKATADEFVRDHCAANNKSWKAQARMLGMFTATLGHKPMAEVTKADLLAVLREIKKGQRGKPAPGQADRCRAVVCKFFKWAEKWDYAPHNPALTLPKLHCDEERDRTLSDAELLTAWRAVEALVQAANSAVEPEERKRLRGWRDGHLCAIFKLLVLTGCRLREVTNLRWAELDLERGEIRLPRERAKNNTAHTVYLSRMAVDILRAVDPVDGSPFVFTTRAARGAAKGAPRPKDFNHKAMTELRGLAKLADEWRLHDLRRTFQSNLCRLGVRFEVREKLTNHTPQGIAAIYERYDYAAECRQAAEDLGEAVARVLAGRDFEPPQRSPLDELAAKLSPDDVLELTRRVLGSNVVSLRSEAA